MKKAQHIIFLCLLCMVILPTEYLCAMPFAEANSLSSQALLKRLRHKHELQDKDNNQKQIKKLVNKLKQKHEQSETKETLAATEQEDRPFKDSADDSVVTDTLAPPEPVIEEEAVSSAPAKASKTEILLAESYETETGTGTAKPKGLNSNLSQKEQSSGKKNELSFGAFFVTLIGLFLAFSIGGNLIGHTCQGGQPGAAAAIGCAMLALGFIGSIFAFARYWPILLLFAISFIFGGSRDSSGCGCGGCLMIIIIILLLF